MVSGQTEQDRPDINSGIAYEELQAYVGNLQIELSSHPSTGSELYKKSQELLSNPIGAHSWPTRTAEELRKVPFSLVAIDGLNFSMAQTIGTKNPEASWVGNPGMFPNVITTEEAKRFVWYSLPENPEFFGLETLSVLCGDFTPEKLVPTINEALTLQTLMENAYNQANLNGQRNNLTGEASLPGVILAALVLAPRLKSDYNAIENKSFDRRDFLKMVLRYGAAFAATALTVRNPVRLLGEMADRISSPRMERFFMELTNTFASTHPPDIVDLRNALLIDKTAEAVAKGLAPRDTVAPVILGRDHIDGLNELLTSPEKRLEVYRDSIRYLRGGIDYAMEQTGKDWGGIIKENPTLVRGVLVDTVMQNIYGSGIVRIHAVREKSGTEAQQTGRIIQAVEFGETYTSCIKDPIEKIIN